MYVRKYMHASRHYTKIGLRPLPRNVTYGLVHTYLFGNRHLAQHPNVDTSGLGHRQCVKLMKWLSSHHLWMFLSEVRSFIISTVFFKTLPFPLDFISVKK